MDRVWPQYAWLLAPAMLGQGAFFARALILRMNGKARLFSPVWSVVLGVSILGGLAYGVLQHDAVVCVAQALFGLLAAAARHMEKNDVQ